jgi:hypothetical protein
MIFGIVANGDDDYDDIGGPVWALSLFGFIVLDIL